MDIYQLKTFVTVAAEGSITKAAQLLYLSQPAVSAHIKTLEDELSVPLFIRTAKGMSLSSQGAALLDKARQLLQLQKELLQDAKALKGLLSGVIRLGSHRGSSGLLLGQLLNQLAEQYPQLEVQIQYGSSAEIVQAIGNGSIDAGFHTAIEQDPKLHHIETGRYGIYLAAPIGWLDNHATDWQQLARLPWILPEKHSCCGQAAAELFVRQGFYPEKVTKVDQEQMTRALISSGVGLGLLHTDSALDAQSKGEVRLVAELDHQASLWFSCLHSRAEQQPMQNVLKLMHQLLHNT